MKEKTIFISKKYANDFNNDKYNLSLAIILEMVKNMILLLLNMVKRLFKKY
ncbi:phage protein [Streptococcus agalactiae]|uniref:Phage protein n=1 Tax=Streptococcus agalactiae TaxID=1311 RepID=A0A7Z7KBM4_STRAG|nr:phage protein [Streptococcus agalactiae]